MRQPIRVAANGSCDVSAFEAFYERYVMACGELGAVPLPANHLLALIEGLVERTTATVH